MIDSRSTSIADVAMTGHNATGRASEIEFHTADADHIVFALNNSIYRLSRAVPSADNTKTTP